MKLCPACKNTYPDDYETCPRDQSPIEVLGAELAPGMVLRGKYEVLRQLGAGGMATVYQVRHKAFHELAAIKVVHAQLMHDPDFIKRFRNEAIVARRLKHPNAVRVEDFDSTEDGRSFIVMEFVDGHSLYELRQRAPGPWPIDRCLNIVSQAAEALGAAHALGIVHRDIKPANILLLGDDRDQIHVKILDFGIAKVTAAFTGMTSVLTKHGLLVGTVQYMSPEQATGAGEEAIDGRSDLYSLGLVLYELLTGAPPFHSDSPASMLMHQIHTVPTPPESIGAVPPAISALALKALRKAPADRFQSAAEMLTALSDPEAWFETVSSKPVPEPKAALPVVPPTVLEPQPSDLPKLHEVTQAEIVRPWVTPKAIGSTKKPWYVVAMIGGLVMFVCGIYLAVHNRPRPEVSGTSKLPQKSAEKTKTDLPAQETPEAMYARAKQLIVRNQYAEALPLTTSACEAGSAAGCTNAGYIYSEGGFGVARNLTRALAFFRRGCNGGIVVGCRNLGFIYQYGKSGVARDSTQAVVFYRKACDGGDASSCSDLGDLYRERLGGTNDLSQGLVFYRKGCDGGDAYGCYKLAKMYDKGTGIAPNPAQALTLHRKACDGGYSQACQDLAFRYDKGTGFEHDPQQAVVFYRKACDGGYAVSCFNLGYLYDHGRPGVAPDSSQAGVFYRKACNLKYQPACVYLKTLNR